MITLEPAATQAIHAFISENDHPATLRIELQSSGCCDANLGLRVDTIQPGDLVYQADDLTFMIRPDIEKQLGDFYIDYVDEAGKAGFVVTSTRPVNEWAGFGVCRIKG